jgi:hypothetical protein
MTEEEWTEWFARAIDAILRGEQPAPVPSGLDGQDLESLLRIARLRLEAAQSTRAASLDYEPEVWQRLVSRIESGKSPAAGPAVPDLDLPERDTEELRDIVALRMQMAREAMQIADAHKDDVWERVRARVGDQAPGKRWLSMFPAGRAPDEPAAVIPATQRHFRRRSVPTDEAVLNELAEQAMARLAEIAADPVQTKIRARKRCGVYEDPAQWDRHQPFWRTWGTPLIAGVGALLVLAAATLVGVSAGIV